MHEDLSAPGGDYPGAFELGQEAARALCAKTPGLSMERARSVVRAGHSSIVLRGNRGVFVMGGLSPDPTATASVDIAVQTH